MLPPLSMHAPHPPSTHVPLNFRACTHSHSHMSYDNITNNGEVPFEILTLIFFWLMVQFFFSKFPNDFCPPSYLPLCPSLSLFAPVLMNYPGVIQSITQPVTKQWLLNVVEKHRWKPPQEVGTKRPHRTHSEGEEDRDLMPPPKIIPRRD